MTPAGVVTLFSMSRRSNHSSYDITSGPDGNFWFTDAGANAAGRITTTGA